MAPPIRIHVPKPPKKAYNPRRKPGTLLQSQLTHLEWAVRPAAERKPSVFRVKPAKTEAEAAARIEELTRELHRQAAVAHVPIAVIAAPPKRAPRARAKARAATSKTRSAGSRRRKSR